MLRRIPLPPFTLRTYYHLLHHHHRRIMATDEETKPVAQDLPVRPKDQNDPQNFDIVATYRSLLSSDREITMPIAAIESLIEFLSVTPYVTSMELVEKVKHQKALLLASAPNPLPILAGADLFEQFLLRSLRPPPAAAASSTSNLAEPMSFDQTREHLVANKQLFAQRAQAARDNIAIWGARYVSDEKVVLTAGGSRTVTKILLRAATDQSKHFKVIYILEPTNSRSQAAVDELRQAGLEVETIVPNKVAYVLANQKKINLVLVGTEAIMQNGGIISGMGTAQLAALVKAIPGGMKRFYVAAETHKIVRKTPIAYPIVAKMGVRQRDISRFENLGVDLDNEGVKEQLLRESDEVDYTDPELIDGIITEQGVKMAWQIWELVDDYI
ncbi:hypothetical protein QBC40DRAFT_286589 [Triangularia verruculosa]|uniref:Translation initiation factor eIF2B subunit alpha n=1 Tax=Triangularia verruculosa TaxID=2587418 RepID=A0AAN6XAQ1_9PEZI|nr:hypothetical protein QBC40DRAFT_286589 [Triangularia verruculosa]